MLFQTVVRLCAKRTAQKQKTTIMKKILFFLIAFAVVCGCNKTDENEGDLTESDAKTTEDNVEVKSHGDGIVNAEGVQNNETDNNSDDNAGTNVDVNSGSDVDAKLGDNAPDAWFTSFTGNYMDAFIIPKGIRLYRDDHSESDDKDFLLVIEASHCYSYNNCWDEDANDCKYVAYTKYYGDTTYTHYHNMSPSEIACAVPLKSINVVADRDFDETHPAGVSLNDIFTLKYDTKYSFIKKEYNNGGDPNVASTYSPADSVSVLSDFRGASLFSSDFFAPLFFNKLPDAPGKYTFTVTLDFGEDPLTGEKVTVPPASIEIEF